MSQSWLPLKDAELLAFCEAFVATITPVPADYGLVAGDVTTLTPLVTAYQDAMATISEPLTRTRVTVATKRIARATLIAAMRGIYKKVLAANLAQDKLEALGLPIHALPSPIPAPATAPAIAIVTRVENTVSLRLFDPEDPNHRGKPQNVDGASLFSFIGETAPVTEADWTFEGITTRTQFDIAFPATTVPGAKVWFTAMWFNPRGLNGPAATPVSTYLPGGAAMAA